MLLQQLGLVGLVLTLALLAHPVAAGSVRSEQYTRSRNKCSGLCAEKGYFQALCARMCQSLNCFRQVYKEGAVELLELGLEVDLHESAFRGCWMEERQSMEAQ